MNTIISKEMVCGSRDRQENKMPVPCPKINYQKLLDEVIDRISVYDQKPSLLLHSCCGPCSSYVVTYLKEYFNVTVFFYNPNIYPEEEYLHRLSEQRRLLKELDVELIEKGYDHTEFLECAKGYESEPEGGARCERCFNLRLKKTHDLAVELGFEYFCTTLTVSPHKNAFIINEIGERLSENILWLPSDFKKRDGYKRSIELSKQYNLYRQDYCGCEFA